MQQPRYQLVDLFLFDYYVLKLTINTKEFHWQNLTINTYELHCLISLLTLTSYTA